MKYSNTILDALERINEKLGGRKIDRSAITGVDVTNVAKRLTV